MKKYNLGIFVFTRDLRLSDNNSLEQAHKLCENILPIFIFTNKQINNNEFKSNKAVQFMIECLDELSQNIKKDNGKLLTFHGKQIEILDELIKKTNTTALFINKDYTPYALEREKEMKELCDKYKIDFHCYEDYLLYENPNKMKKFYQKFTPYYNYKIQQKVEKPKGLHKMKWSKLFIDTKFNNLIEINEAYINLTKISRSSAYEGGRIKGLLILNRMKEYIDYGKTRNTLAINTTGLSAYMKFGCLSCREVYYNIKENLGLKHDLIKQLIWREFYLQLIIGFPRVLNGKSLKEKYDEIVWLNDKKLFKKWCNGETGFPIVDACMKQLNNTGFMHNRGRLITASFLVKNLHIDWRWGEKYFATKLIDYDPASNNGNWQWVAGSGADSMPYFRIFNPWRQSERFDLNGSYIKYWLPFLNEVEAKDLHNWGEEKVRSKYDIDDYEPIIDYSKSREVTLELYKKYL